MTAKTDAQLRAISCGARSSVSGWRRARDAVSAGRCGRTSPISLPSTTVWTHIASLLPWRWLEQIPRAQRDAVELRVLGSLSYEEGRCFAFADDPCRGLQYAGEIAHLVYAALEPAADLMPSVR
jgi:hypothetical protein